MNIRGDIPVEDDSSRRTVVTELGIKSDPQLSDGNGTFLADESWGLCVGYMRFANISDDEIQPDGITSWRYENHLSEACAGWLEDYVASGKFCQADPTARLWEGSPCEDDPGIEADMEGRLEHAYRYPLNGTRFDRFSKLTSTSYPDSDTAAYDEAVRSVWLVMLGWAPSEEMRDEDGVASGDGRTVPGEAFMLRVHNFTNGSRDFAAIEEDAAMGLQAGWTSAVGVAAGVAAVLSSIL